MKTNSDNIRPSDISNSRQHKHRRWPYFIIILLVALLVIPFFTPLIISTSVVRTLILTRINKAIEGTLSVRQWDVSWTKGIELKGIRYVAYDPGICVEAEGLIIGFSIPELASAAYAIHKTNHRDDTQEHHSLKGEISLFRGKFSTGLHPNSLTLVSDVNAFIKVDGLYTPYSFMITAYSEPEIGSLSATGTIHALPDRVYDLETIQFNAGIKASNWNIADLARTLFDIRDMPHDIKAPLTGNILVKTEGIHTLDLKGELTLRPSVMSQTDIAYDLPPIFDFLNIQFDLAKRESNIVISELTTESDFCGATLSGDLALSDAYDILKADIDFKGSVDMAQAMRVIKAFYPKHITENIFDHENAMLDMNGALSIDMDGKTNIKDGLSLAVKADFRGLNIDNIMPMALIAMKNDNVPAMKGWSNGQIDLRVKALETLDAKVAINIRDFSVADGFINQNTVHAEDIKIDVDVSLTLPPPLNAKGSLKIATYDLSLSGFESGPLSMNSAQLAFNAKITMDETGQIQNISQVSLSAESDLASLNIQGENLLLTNNAITSIKNINIETASDLSLLIPFIYTILNVHNDREITGNMRASATGSLHAGMMKLTDIDVVMLPFELRQPNGLQIKNSARAQGEFAISVAEIIDKRLRQSEARCTLYVESVKYLGISVSNLTSPIRIKDDILDLHIETSVNQGKLSLPLRVNLAAKPMILEIPEKTRVLHNVRLTDNMINELLGFISPLLKDSAASTGTISAQVDRCRIPLGGIDLANTDFQCTSFFRDITITPKSLLLEILSLAQLQREKVSIPDQQVQSYLRDGRVYSSPLSLKAGAYNITISGSVGLDQTIDYTAQIPLTLRMVGKDAYEYLRGQSVSLPISGTVKRPVFDRDRFLRETRKTVVDTGTRELIEKGVEGLLKKWLSK